MIHYSEHTKNNYMVTCSEHTKNNYMVTCSDHTKNNYMVTCSDHTKNKLRWHALTTPRPTMVQHPDHVNDNNHD